MVSVLGLIVFRIRSCIFLFHFRRESKSVARGMGTDHLFTDLPQLYHWFHKPCPNPVKATVSEKAKGGIYYKSVVCGPAFLHDLLMNSVGWSTIQGRVQERYWTTFRILRLEGEEQYSFLYRSYWLVLDGSGFSFKKIGLLAGRDVNFKSSYTTRRTIILE